MHFHDEMFDNSGDHKVFNLRIPAGENSDGSVVTEAEACRMHRKERKRIVPD